MEGEAVKQGRQQQKESRLVLQPRDIEIIQCCYEQQFLTYDQVERFYFRDADPRIARRRILRLKQAGLLRAESIVGLSSQQLLRVTELGRRLAKQTSSFEVPQAKRLDPATLVHDRIVTDVRLRLRELWDGVWIPEKALGDKYPLIPDGLIQFEQSGMLVAIEIENSLKGYARFKSILSEWQRTEGVMLVLFVATDQKIFDTICARFKEAPTQPAFGVVALDALMRTTPVVESPRGHLDIFKGRSL